MSVGSGAAGDWAQSLSFGASLLADLDRLSRVDGALSRQSYAPAEQAAHDFVAGAGAALDLEPQVDAAGNLHLVFAGLDPDAPSWFTGSHLDSVPDGGNFDGAAGVVAALVVMHAWRRRGHVPRRPVTLVAFRGEEGSSWFGGAHHSHFGSRSLLGQLSAAELGSARSLADGRSLAQWIEGAGFDPGRIACGSPLVPLERIHRFVELHIEQGPVLVADGTPVGLVTGIRGSLRVRSACCLGEDAHSGAVPREHRRDALLAAAAFATALERQWEKWLAGGRDVVCTLGRFGTDPARHSLTKVPGRVDFSIDIRSVEPALLGEAERYLRRLAARIGAERRVEFELGTMDTVAPAPMSPVLQQDLARHAEALGLRTRKIASGAGHDAANFAGAGVPAAMIFVRNAHGSHNRREAMDIGDFSDGARLLDRLLAEEG